MTRRRRWTDGQLVRAVRNNTSVAGALRDLGLAPTGANYKTIHRYVEEFKLPTDHWTGQGHLRGKTHNWTPSRPLVEILVVNSDYMSTSNLKTRLIREGVLQNKCYECGLGPLWNGLSLVMVLDHINGCNRDHRRLNLRLLCPNCNSQQETFCRGINKGYDKSFKRNALELAEKLGVAAAARTLGVPGWTIRRWRKERRW